MKHVPRHADTSERFPHTHIVVLAVTEGASTSVRIFRTIQAASKAASYARALGKHANLEIATVIRGGECPC